MTEPAPTTPQSTYNHMRKRYNLELLNRENIVPPCTGYTQAEPSEQAGEQHD